MGNGPAGPSAPETVTTDPATAQPLTVVGTEVADGPVLVLQDEHGRRYRVPVDARLRTAVRAVGSPTPVTQEEQPLRPRDIQARIRAGESAAEVAEDAGVPVAQVQRYEGPVLAERAHTAGRARAALVRTAAGRPTLEDLVRQRLVARGADAATVTWNAWRRGEARWSVQASYLVGSRPRAAVWAFDPATTALEAMDDEARWLIAVQDVEPTTGRRLAAVRVYDVEDEGGIRFEAAAPSVPEVPAEPEALTPEDVAARTMDLLDALRDRRGRRLPLMELDDGPLGWEDDDDDEDDELVSALLDLPPGAHPAASRPDEATDDEVLGASEPPPEPRLRAVPRREDTGELTSVGTGGSDGSRVEDAGDREPRTSWLDVVIAPVTGPEGLPAVPPAATGRDDGDTPEEPAEKPTTRPRRRSSVPSWDEIVFGSPKPE